MTPVSPFSRRQALLASAAATCTSFFDLPTFAISNGFADSTDDAFGGLPMGVQSYSLRNFSLVEAVRHISGMGLKYVEFYSKHLNPGGPDQQVQDVKELCKKAGISINAHGVSTFSKNHENNGRIFEFAKRAGIKNLTANPQPDAFDSLERWCAKYKIRICIHNHGPGSLYDKISDVTKAVKGRHPLIGACVDTGHFIRSQEDPVQAVHQLKGRVFALHVKDEEKREKRSKNVIIGTGHLDLVGLFQSLRDTEFPADGSVSLEYEANPNNPIDDIKQCIVQAQAAISKLK
ncbi:MAG: sugar phosphate isomerase/epimerase [Planctomycetota bacterium]|nr:sugar phosphate isomerase/epimerase [Planctomycetota bacterium]